MNDKIMRIELASAKHESIFNEWGKFDRIETKTCRPVMDGKRLPSNDKPVIFAFLIDELEEPVGKFRYFNINPRNHSAEFGYTVNPKYRNQGLGTNILVLIINNLFKTTDFHKFYCQTACCGKNSGIESQSQNHQKMKPRHRRKNDKQHAADGMKALVGFLSVIAVELLQLTYLHRTYPTNIKVW